MATWLEKSRSPEYSPAKLSQMLAEVEAVIGISELDEAMAHETIIVGGYLNTHLIKAKSIVGGKIASNAITTRHIQADAITADKIAANSITTDKIASNAITTQHIQAGAITAEHMNVDRLSSIVADTGYLRVGDGAVTIDGENNRIQANHADGSYTRMSSEGLLRYVAGTNYSYNYLLYVGEVDIEITSEFMNSVYITLPSEFIGTNYEVFVSIGSFVTPQHRFIDTIVIGGSAVSNNRILVAAGLSAAKAEPRWGTIQVPLSDPITDYFLTGDVYNLFNEGMVRVQYIVIA